MARQTNITGLPPTLGIQDPTMRAWADAFSNAWAKRNGAIGPEDGERFVKLSEIGDLAGRAVADAFAGGVVGGASGGFGQNPSAQQINQSIDNLADSIRKSILYQLLEQQITPVQLETIRQNLEGSINDAFTYIGTETTERTTDDLALAQAIQTIWASVGGTDAIIQSGSLTETTPNTAQATKWNQVVAAVTDPNTGNVNDASIVEELDAYANSADGTFNAIYSVRAQVSVGGQTVVGGFGLSATAGAGSAQGPTIDFGVRADRFFIAATSETPNAATQIGQGSHIPFMVLTSPQVVNGVVYGPGVYIKKAVIGDATIGNAQIANASITNAKIADLEVTNAKIANAAITTAKIGEAQIDTLRIGANQVTIPWSFSTNGAIAFSGVSSWTTIQEGAIQCFGGQLFIHGSSDSQAVGVYNPGPDQWTATAPIRTRLLRNGALLAESSGSSISYIDAPGAGVFVYALQVLIAQAPDFGSPWGTADGSATYRNLLVLETRR